MSGEVSHRLMMPATTMNFLDPTMGFRIELLIEKKTSIKRKSAVLLSELIDWRKNFCT
jgi:hypothetical protein